MERALHLLILDLDRHHFVISKNFVSILLRLMEKLFVALRNSNSQVLMGALPFIAHSLEYLLWANLPKFFSDSVVEACHNLLPEGQLFCSLNRKPVVLSEAQS